MKLNKPLLAAAVFGASLLLVAVPSASDAAPQHKSSGSHARSGGSRAHSAPRTHRPAPRAHHAPRAHRRFRHHRANVQRGHRAHNRSSVTRNRARQGKPQIERRSWRNHQTKARERTRDINRARAADRRTRSDERRDRAHDARPRRGAHFNNHQRTRIRSYYRGHRHHFHRVARVSWPIVIGSFVPRDYTVYDIPSDFYGYVPGYEGYKYVVVGDQLIIIDPDTWEIVAIIPL